MTGGGRGTAAGGGTGRLERLLGGQRVIAAVRTAREFQRALSAPPRLIFLLESRLVQLPGLVREAHGAGKALFVHGDRVEGLSPDEAGVDFLATSVVPDGLISTHPAVIAAARARRLQAVQRVFALDSAGLASARRLAAQGEADAVEILPGLLPRVVARFAREMGRPVITGGLLESREDVEAALAAGARAVSASSEAIWQLADEMEKERFGHREESAVEGRIEGLTTSSDS
ncbi:MAG: glycerol-3-phosphate responsive antiterminator [Bacillota bacterium]|nr:glycerol-3-phosphate responsive antiterminator [Bacillota bacterium]